MNYFGFRQHSAHKWVYYMTYGYNTAINIDKGVQIVKLQIISIMMMAGLKIGMSEPGFICFTCFRIL